MSLESRSNQTTQEILRAGCTCLSERGCVATTISEIACGRAREALGQGLREAVEREVIDPDIPLVGVADGLVLQFLPKPELAPGESIGAVPEMATLALLRGME